MHAHAGTETETIRGWFDPTIADVTEVLARMCFLRSFVLSVRSSRLLLDTLWQHAGW